MTEKTKPYSHLFENSKNTTKQKLPHHYTDYKMNNRHYHLADYSHLKKDQQNDKTVRLQSSIACSGGNIPIRTFEPSKGGTGKKLNTANITLIHTDITIISYTGLITLYIR